MRHCCFRFLIVRVLIGDCRQGPAFHCLSVGKLEQWLGHISKRIDLNPTWYTGVQRSCIIFCQCCLACPWSSLEEMLFMLVQDPFHIVDRRISPAMIFLGSNFPMWQCHGSTLPKKSWDFGAHAFGSVCFRSLVPRTWWQWPIWSALHRVPQW